MRNQLPPTMKKFYTAIILTIGLSLCFCQLSLGQIGIINSPPLIADTLVSRLVGEGVEFSNASLRCGDSGVGYFFGGDSFFSMKAGIVLTTGTTRVTFSANTSGSASAGGGPGYALLEDLPNTYNGTFNACVLEFDFVPLGKEITVRYVFGSEEYPEYVGSGFADIMAIFIQGGNEYAEHTNVALVPGTADTPVRITHINADAFSGLYIDNTGGEAIQYDGYTVPLTAKASVTPCESYHLILAIADVGDAIYDSGVFLEEYSFQSSGLEEFAEIEVWTPAPKLCGEMTTVNLAVKPVEGMTFEWSPAEYVTVESEDGSMVKATPPEGGESFIYTVTSLTPYACLQSSATIEVTKAQELEISVDAPEALCIDLANPQPIAIKAFGADIYSWDPIGVLDPINPGASEATFVPNPDYNSLTLQVIGSDESFDCMGEVNFSIQVFQELAVEIASLEFLTDSIHARLSAEVMGGSGDFQYEWYPDAGLSVSDSSVTLVNLDIQAAVTYELTVTDLVADCQQTASITLDPDFVAIDEFIMDDSKPYQLYPNFIYDRFQLNYKLQRSASLKVSLFALSGQEVGVLLEEENAPMGKQEREVDLKGWNLAKGIYIVELRLEGKVFREKVFVF